MFVSSRWQWLQISTQTINLVDDEVHVSVGRLQVADDEAEEVDTLAQRLIANQHCSLFHHSLLDFRSHLQNIPYIYINSRPTEAKPDRWHIPERASATIRSFPADHASSVECTRNRRWYTQWGRARFGSLDGSSSSAWCTWTIKWLVSLESNQVNRAKNRTTHWARSMMLLISRSKPTSPFAFHMSHSLKTST